MECIDGFPRRWRWQRYALCSRAAIDVQPFPCAMVAVNVAGSFAAGLFGDSGSTRLIARFHKMRNQQKSSYRISQIWYNLRIFKERLK